MKVKDLIEALKEYPKDASVELSTLLGADLSSEDQAIYEVFLDYPIIGLAYNDKDNDVRLVVSHSPEDKWLKRFGKVKRLENEEEKPHP
jgi:hypothetical protein